MPRIREYRSKAAAQGLDVGPLVSLAGAQAQTGRMQGQAIRDTWDAAGNAAKSIGASVEKWQEQNDMTLLAKNTAMVHAQLNVGWQDYQAQHADDPEAAEKYMDEVVNPALDKLGDDISSRNGREVYEKARGGIAADLFQKTHSDQSKLRGDNAVNSLLTFKNKAAEGLMRDPSGLDNMNNLADVMIKGFTSSANLGAEQAIGFKRDLIQSNARAAFMGSANANPAAALEDLAHGKYADYFDAGDIATMQSYATTRQNAAEQDVRAAEAEQKKALKESANADAAVLSASMLNEDGTMSVPADFNKQLVDYAVEHAGVEGADDTIRALANMARSVTEDNAKGVKSVTDPAVYADFRQRVVLPAGNPRSLSEKDVYQAKADRKLSDGDFMMFKGWVTEAGKNPERVKQQQMLNRMFDGFKSSITKANPMMNAFDAPGDKLFYKFQVDMQGAFEAGLKKGDAVETLLDPSSPKFIARNLKPYQMTQEQTITEVNDWVAGKNLTQPAAQPARDAGESWDAYKQRTGWK